MGNELSDFCVEWKGQIGMKNHREIVCWVAMVATGLVGCSNEAEKLQLEKLQMENQQLQKDNQQLQKDNAAFKKDLAGVSKSLENSLSFPAGWANQTSPAKELEEFEKPGTYEGTSEVSLPDGNVLHMKQVSKVMLGNGGTCLVNAVVESQEGLAEPNSFLQILTYEQQRQIYRVINIFKEGSVSVLEVQDGGAVEAEGTTGHRKRKWQPVYTSDIPETAELQMNIGINEARDEMEWNWAVIEGQETMISGKGIKRRVE